VAAAIVGEVNLAKLDAARFAVLDLTDPDAAPMPANMATIAPAPAIDLAPTDIPPAIIATAGVTAPAFEFA
jgi:hypothetical protein